MRTPKPHIKLDLVKSKSSLFNNIYHNIHPNVLSTSSNMNCNNHTNSQWQSQNDILAHSFPRRHKYNIHPMPFSTCKLTN